MTKRNLFVYPTLFILLTSIQAVRIFLTDYSPPYSFMELNFLAGLITFLVITYFAFAVNEKYWRIGVMLVALASIARHCIRICPEQKLIFVSLTLALNVFSIIALYASWRALAVDFTWGVQNKSALIVKLILIGLVVTAIAGIFIYWGRG